MVVSVTVNVFECFDVNWLVVFVRCVTIVELSLAAVFARLHFNTVELVKPGEHHRVDVVAYSLIKDRILVDFASLQICFVTSLTELAEQLRYAPDFGIFDIINRLFGNLCYRFSILVDLFSRKHRMCVIAFESFCCALALLDEKINISFIIPFSAASVVFVFVCILAFMNFYSNLFF